MRSDTTEINSSDLRINRLMHHQRERERERERERQRERQRESERQRDRETEREGISLKRETEPVAITGINIILTGSKLDLDHLTSPDGK